LSLFHAKIITEKASAKNQIIYLICFNFMCGGVMLFTL